MEPTILSIEIKERIKSMHDTKVKENKKKLDILGGSYNMDDHGFIYFEDFSFEAKYPEGYEIMFGPKCVGENLGRFYKEMPVYIHPKSALAGTWPGFFQNFVKLGYRPEDEAVHLKPVHDKYNMTANNKTIPIADIAI